MSNKFLGEPHVFLKSLVPGITFLQLEQHNSLVQLLCQLNGNYNEGHVVAQDVMYNHLLVNLLGPNSLLRIVVCVSSSSKVVGFGAFAYAFSLVEAEAHKNKQCQLKELFVLPEARNNGVGRALVQFIARHALESGCCRMEWPVKSENDVGRGFYKSLGAMEVSNRLSYRLSKEAMGDIATSEIRLG